MSSSTVEGASQIRSQGAPQSQEAARGAEESPEEVAAIEHEILPKMIVAGFSTVTITSVIVTSIIVGHIGS